MSETETKTKIGRPKKQVKLNENGERLTKAGKVDKRVAQAKINLQKSGLYQALEQAKMLKKEKKNETLSSLPDSDDESSEEEDEYEMEEIVVKKKSEPQIVEVEKVVEKVIEKEVVKEVVKEDPIKEAKMKRLQENNKKLKDQFDAIERLNDIHYRARAVGIKR